MIQFYTQFDRPVGLSNEPVGGEKVVERAGYMSAEKQIKSMLQAGVRLQTYRNEMFDTVDPKVDPGSLSVDPMRSKAFDLADASQTALAIAGRRIIRRPVKKQSVSEGSSSTPPVSDAVVSQKT